MKKTFDVIVIGTGSAASSVAFRCRAAGRTVAIIDSRPFGGTCALRGCDPKKVLVGAADLVDWCRRMEDHGVKSGPATIDWPALMRFKRSFTDSVSGGMEGRLAEAGISAIHGRVRFVGPASVEVGGDTLEAKQFVIAAGSKPGALNIPGEEHLMTSDRFLELDRLPAQLVFAGGGYIAFEFAHLAARAGAEVTILHRGERPLNQFDPELVDILLEQTRSLNIRVELGAGVTAIEPRRDRFAVTTGSQTFEADAVVHAAGRAPDIDDMNLAAAQVDCGPQGVVVNEYLQSVSNPTVYSAGDSAASGGPPLSPIASYEGVLAATNLLEGNHLKTDYPAVASVVFTVPPLATVGLDDAGAKKAGFDFRSHLIDTSKWYSSRRVRAKHTAAKVLIDNPTGRILGAHILGPHADETINVFALAIRAKLPASMLLDTFFSYPTHGSDIRYMLRP